VAVTAYQVFRGGVFLATVSAAPLSATYGYTDTGLVAATLYSYTITACDAAGNCSILSAAAVATTPDNVAPTQVGSVTATASNNQIALTWSAASDNVAVTDYQVFRNGSFLARQ
jgi:chitodextrinase